MTVLRGESCNAAAGAENCLKPRQRWSVASPEVIGIVLVNQTVLVARRQSGGCASGQIVLWILAAGAAERITPGLAEACRQKPRDFFISLSLCVARNRKRLWCCVSGDRNHEVQSPRFFPQRGIFLCVTISTCSALQHVLYFIFETVSPLGLLQRTNRQTCNN